MAHSESTRPINLLGGVQLPEQPQEMSDVSVEWHGLGRIRFGLEGVSNPLGSDNLQFIVSGLSDWAVMFTGLYLGDNMPNIKISENDPNHAGQASLQLMEKRRNLNIPPTYKEFWLKADLEKRSFVFATDEPYELKDDCEYRIDFFFYISDEGLNGEWVNHYITLRSDRSYYIGQSTISMIPNPPEDFVRSTEGAGESPPFYTLAAGLVLHDILIPDTDSESGTVAGSEINGSPSAPN